MWLILITLMHTMQACWQQGHLQTTGCVQWPPWSSTETIAGWAEAAAAGTWSRPRKRSWVRSPGDVQLAAADLWSLRMSCQLSSINCNSRRANYPALTELCNPLGLSWIRCHQYESTEPSRYHLGYLEFIVLNSIRLSRTHRDYLKFTGPF